MTSDNTFRTVIERSKALDLEAVFKELLAE